MRAGFAALIRVSDFDSGRVIRFARSFHKRNKVLAHTGHFAYIHCTFLLPAVMRLRSLLLPLCAVLLGSCAYQGTIVQKDAAPLSLTLSYGIDGSYAFLLRDNTGTVRRQIVTPEVYNQYAVGDYFNDLQPRQVTDGKSFDGKGVMTAMMTKVTKSRQIATTKKPEQKRQIAKLTPKPATAKKPVAKVAKQSRPVTKPQQPTRVAAAPQVLRALPVERPIELPPQILRPRPVWDNELAYISVPRCR